MMVASTTAKLCSTACTVGLQNALNRQPHFAQRLPAAKSQPWCDLSGYVELSCSLHTHAVAQAGQKHSLTFFPLGAMQITGLVFF